MGLGLTLCVAQQFLLGGAEERRRGAFDLLGALLLLLGYPALLIALSLGPHAGWESDEVAFWFAVAAIGLTGFVLRETRFNAPLFQFRLFRSLPFCIAMFTLIVSQFVLSPVTLFTPLYLEKVQALDPLTIGLMMMALPLSTVIAGPIGGRLADLHEPRVVAAAGAAVTLVAVFLYAQLGLNTAALWVLVPLVLVGIGAGLFRPANQVAVYSATSVRDYGMISAMLTSLGGLAGTMGATISVAISESRERGTDAASFASGQQFAFMMLVPLLVVSVVVSILQRPGRRREATPSVALDPVESAARPDS